MCLTDTPTHFKFNACTYIGEDVYRKTVNNDEKKLRSLNVCCQCVFKPIQNNNKMSQRTICSLALNLLCT